MGDEGRLNTSVTITPPLPLLSTQHSVLKTDFFCYTAFRLRFESAGCLAIPRKLLPPAYYTPDNTPVRVTVTTKPPVASTAVEVATAN